jgi:hypothetical protein
MFITDLNQSPFNVGDDFELVDFNRDQVEELNKRHYSPVHTTQEMDGIIELFQGHPFLVRKAFYELAAGHLTPSQLMKQAYDDDGPFGDHMHRFLFRFDKLLELRAAMKSVIRDNNCPTDYAFYQLRTSGLVRGQNRTSVTPRCGLYAKYFEAHL